MPQRMESKGSTDLDALQQQQARSNAQYAARAFSVPTPGGGGALQQYGGAGSLFGGMGGANGHASAMAAATTAALQVLDVLIDSDLTTSRQATRSSTAGRKRYV